MTVNEFEIDRNMLICCGSMAIIFGTVGISSLATATGLSTGQTYLAIAGFVLATGTLVVVLYRKQTSEKLPAGSSEGTKQGPQ